jgi:thiol-disulfide isomerase/thioredoxin
LPLRFRTGLLAVAPLEDQAVRIFLGVGLAIVCLGLTGCSLFNKKQAASNPRPFMGAEPARPTGGQVAAAPEPHAPLTGVNGLLAGQVLDQYNHRSSKALIQVVDLQAPPSPSASLEVATTEDGFFTIAGLKPGRHYRLIARVEDGGRTLSGSTLGTPPNPRLAIFLSGDYTSPSTPPLPPRLGADQNAGGPPGATLAPPIKGKPEGDSGKPAPKGDGTSSTGGAGGAMMLPAVKPPNLTNVVEVDGFNRVQPPKVNVPSPPPQPQQSIPLPPQPWSPVPSGPAMPSLPPAVPAPGPGAHPGVSSTPQVPSCQLVGKRLYNFALYDVNHQVWEFQRDRRGRVVLLDFWGTYCLPCLESIQYLRQLQDLYGPYGLETVGIAYEKGSPIEQSDHVRGARTRYRINYTVLLGGSGPTECPVKTQFGVTQIPSLFLLDENGEILWHHVGQLDADIYRDLAARVYQRLNTPPR